LIELVRVVATKDTTKQHREPPHNDETRRGFFQRSHLKYRSKTEQARWFLNLSFLGGSFAATFIQNLTVGALVEGLPWANGQYVGADFGWFTSYAVLSGIGL
jgi:cytochrome bd-type quinol oxidase subunit 2